MELVKRWSNHKVMVRWLSRFFYYLDRYYVTRRSLRPLNEVGLACFHDLVYTEMNVKVRDAVISLIDRDREGEQIDRALLKNVVDIYVEIGMGKMEHYVKDFESSMLEATAAYCGVHCSFMEHEQISSYCRLWSSLQFYGKLGPLPMELLLLLVFLNRLLGTPTEEVWLGVSSLKDWHVYPRWEAQSLARAVPSLGPDGVNLLSKMLKYNPVERISAKQAMDHPYFDSLDRSQF